MTDDRRPPLEQSLQQAAEAAEVEWAATDEPRYARTRARSQDPSQVYSVRIPVDAIARLRDVADEQGVRPTALMREWVLERLAQEDASVPGSVSTMMRTTVAIDDDVLATVREMAAAHGLPLGKMVSDVLRKGLRPATRLSVADDGLPVVVVPEGARAITDDGVTDALESP